MYMLAQHDNFNPRNKQVYRAGLRRHGVASPFSHRDAQKRSSQLDQGLKFCKCWYRIQLSSYNSWLCCLLHFSPVSPVLTVPCLVHLRARYFVSHSSCDRYSKRIEKGNFVVAKCFPPIMRKTQCHQPDPFSMASPIYRRKGGEAKVLSSMNITKRWSTGSHARNRCCCTLHIQAHRCETRSTMGNLQMLSFSELHAFAAQS